MPNAQRLAPSAARGGAGDRPRLVLASASPRRRMLLDRIGLRFTVRPTRIDETIADDEPSAEAVERLAREKVAFRATADELVLGADTVVVVDDEILGKPRDPRDAEAMLDRLAGRRHRVLTGVAIRDGVSERTVSTVESADVALAEITIEEIAWYVGTGEPLDKAGSYAIQGIGSMFVDAIEGDYTNVVGLPMSATRRLFGELGRDIRDWMTDRSR